jgi:putative spermidine/putrescine transport system permease protein
MSLSLWSSLLGGAVGFFFAHAISRMKSGFQRQIIAFNTLPLTLSAVVLAYGFLVVFGESGVVNALLRRLGAASQPLRVNILTIGGLVFVYLIFQVPLMTVILLSAMLAADPHVEEAAMSVGANRFRILFCITVPRLAPALIGGFFLLFINALGAYATAYSLVGANMNLVTLKIVSQFSDVGYDPGTANALSVMIVVLDTLFVIAYRISIEKVKK